MKKKHGKIPTILGLVILIIGAIAGVYLVTKSQVLSPQASTDLTPQDIRLSNVTDTSFTVSWVTDAATFGTINWGQNQSLGNNTTDNDLRLKITHYVTVKNLSPQTTYYYKVNSGGKSFDNAGIPWQVQTLAGSSFSSNPQVISGVVIDENGIPAGDVIVYVDTDGASTLSAKTATNGSFIIPITIDLDPENLLQVFVQGGSLGVSSAQIFARSANAIPTMTLGQSHDFRNIEDIKDSGLPKSSIDIPDTQTQPESKIILD